MTSWSEHCYCGHSGGAHDSSWCIDDPLGRACRADGCGCDRFEPVEIVAVVTHVRPDGISVTYQAQSFDPATGVLLDEHGTWVKPLDGTLKWEET